MRLKSFITIAIVIMIISGCSGGNPVTTDSDNPLPEQLNYANSESGNNLTGIMGPYELILDADSQTVELTSKRQAAIGESYIVSGRSYFVTQPCSDCLVIQGMGYKFSNVFVNFGIKHPFEPGSDLLGPPSGKNRLDLDIFDAALVVKPIGISPETYPLTGATIQNGVITSADGYTTELAHIFGEPSALPYVLAVDDSAAIPPAGTYNKFAMGAEAEFDVLFPIAPGGNLQFDLYLTFAYGFSAVLEDRFEPKYSNPEFNRKAAWKVNVTPPSGWLSFDDVIPTYVEIEVYDWQVGANVDPALTNPTDVYAASEIESVSVEIPGMNPTLISVPGSSAIYGTGMPDDPLVYQIPIRNDNLIASGDYIGVVKVTDQRTPQLPASGRDFIIDSPDGKARNFHEMPEYATYQTFPATVSDNINFNPVDVTPPGLHFYPIDICVDGNYAYTAGESHGIHIFDISNPTDPVWVQKINTDGYPNRIFIIGNYACVTDEKGLNIIDISIPEYPDLIGYIETPDDCFDVYVEGTYAYVADEDDGLQIIDVSDPTTPAIINSVDTDGQALSVCISGDYAYIADYDYGVSVIDISDHMTASVVHQITTGADAFDVIVRGNYLYVGTDNDFEVWDINTPTAATIVNTISLFDPYCIHLDGDYAYVPDGSFGMAVIDISSPGLESVVKVVDTPGNACDVFTQNGYAYLADSRCALHVIDVDPLAQAEIIDTTHTIDTASRVTVSGEYAYVSNGRQIIYILDIAPPGAAGIINAVEMVGYSHDVELYQDYAYVAARSGGMHVMNISDPYNVSIVNTVTGLNNAYALDIYNDHIFACDPPLGIQILGLSSPTTPNQVNTVLTTLPLAVHAAGNYACVADATAGVQIIDITDPTTGGIVGSCNTDGSAQGIFTYNGYAYVADWDEGLAVVDIDPPGSAFVDDKLSITGKTYGIVVKYGYAFVANTYNGLVIIDIDPPGTLELVTTLDTIGSGSDIVVEDGYAYLAAGYGGLRVIDLW
jgi:hypothetical protein